MHAGVGKGQNEEFLYVRFGGCLEGLRAERDACRNGNSLRKSVCIRPTPGSHAGADHKRSSLVLILAQGTGLSRDAILRKKQMSHQLARVRRAKQ